MEPKTRNGRRKFLIWGGSVAAGCAVAAALVLPVLAQNGVGIDVQKLRGESKERAAEMGDFARELRARGEEVRDEALGVRESAEKNLEEAEAVFAGMPKSEGPLDFEEMTRQAGEVRRGGGGGMAKGPAFLAFASTSMPAHSLRQMAKDVTAAGGFMVFRGFPNNDGKAFQTKLADIFGTGQVTGNIGVDPRLFRAFQVDAVPTYVVTTNEIDLCDGFACVNTVPPHDRIEGNVSAGYALETFAAGGGPGSAASRVFLRRVESKKEG